MFLRVEGCKQELENLRKRVNCGRGKEERRLRTIFCHPENNFPYALWRRADDDDDCAFLLAFSLSSACVQVTWGKKRGKKSMVPFTRYNFDCRFCSFLSSPSSTCYAPSDSYTLLFDATQRTTSSILCKNCFRANLTLPLLSRPYWTTTAVGAT